MLINYSLIGKAVDYYQKLGYTYIDVDWMVESRYAEMTWGDPVGWFATQSMDNQYKILVGSAEQGFIQAVARGQVELDKLYVSVTPCFRRGDIGPINQETFMKVELSMASTTDGDAFKRMIMDAK